RADRYPPAASSHDPAKRPAHDRPPPEAAAHAEVGEGSQPLQARHPDQAYGVTRRRDRPAAHSCQTAARLGHPFTMFRSATSSISEAGSTGLTMWRSNPASSHLRLSSSAPQPVTAMLTMFLLHVCCRLRRDA